MNKIHSNGKRFFAPAIAAGLVLAMAFTLNACGGDGGGGGGGDDTTVSSSSGNGSLSSSSSGGGSLSSSSQPSHEHTWGEWSVTAAPTCEAAGTKTRTCTGNNSHKDTEEIAKLEYDHTEKFCYNSKIGNFCGINPQEYDPDLYQCKPSINGNGIFLKQGITDSRDGETYEAVLIGTQIWMAENLNHETNDGSSRCYGDNTGGDSQNRCGTYGRLYNWNTANPSGVQGVCPSGWHLPSDAEWNVLMKFVEPSCSDNANCAGAGTKLKATSGWNAHATYGDGTDDYGFSALPGGIGYTTGYFGGVGGDGYWWSASEYDSGSAYNRYMVYIGEDAYYNYNNKDGLFSVRCLQD
ncbi:MAG: hypothetical protein LBH25_03585 [Fibromonadaceae bacterium]|jgi:uncharacterized protein (TIGR02145 family)|nr:hypothetical protein [Fibromonadaceae bacterium]